MPMGKRTNPPAICRGASTLDGVEVLGDFEKERNEKEWIHQGDQRGRLLGTDGDGLGINHGTDCIMAWMSNLGVLN